MSSNSDFCISPSSTWSMCCWWHSYFFNCIGSCGKPRFQHIYRIARYLSAESAGKAIQLTLMSEILGAFINVGHCRAHCVSAGDPPLSALRGPQQRYPESEFLAGAEFKRSAPANTIRKKWMNWPGDATGDNTKTGALIVIPQTSQLRFYQNTGIHVNALITRDIIESIFYKTARCTTAPLSSPTIKLLLQNVCCHYPTIRTCRLNWDCVIAAALVFQNKVMPPASLFRKKWWISYAREGKLYQHIQPTGCANSLHGRYFTASTESISALSESRFSAFSP